MKGVLRKRDRGDGRVWLAVALIAVFGSTVLFGTLGGRHEPTSALGDRFVPKELPGSDVGRQVRWLIEASAQGQLDDAKVREHFSARFRERGATKAFLGALADAQKLRMLGLPVVERATLVAEVQARADRRLVLTVFVNSAGRIDNATLRPVVVLPRPTGRAQVGTDRVQLLDGARNRRLMLTRWYPTSGDASERPLAQYASPRLAAALASDPQYANDPHVAALALSLPSVRVNARTGARARRGRLPVVLFSPGSGASRVLYQALAEDLASHGYLVVSVDHTGEAPVELDDGQIVPTSQLPIPVATRGLADMRLVLRRLNTMRPGPEADFRRVAAIGHSLGGSTAALLMRAEPSVLAGVDLDGAIWGSALRRGVPRAFMVMSADEGVLAYPTTRPFLERSHGPRLALEFSGFEHFSFSDAPILDPGVTPGNLAAQRAYLRAFLDRYLLGRGSTVRSSLVAESSCSAAAVRLEESRLVGKYYCLDAVTQVELPENMRHVRLDSRVAVLVRSLRWRGR